MTIETPTESKTSTEGNVLEAIIEVAPDLTLEDLDASVDLHDDIGLDSIDLLNISSAIAQRTGFEIPEVELARLHTVGDMVEFVALHCGTTA